MSNTTNFFEYPELLDIEAQTLLNKWAEILINGAEYSDLENMLTEFQAIGLTFDYGLDAEPYNLRYISENE
jgi:hypothetical protein